MGIGMCIKELRTERGLDTGDILLARALQVSAQDTAGTLAEKLSALGGACICEAFSRLERGEASFTVQDGSLIGVHHTPAYNRTSAETYVLTGALMLAEIKDYIVKVTINDAPNLTVEVDGTVTTAAESS